MGNFYVYEGAAQSSKCQTWNTPRWLFDSLNSEFNFTLDAAADDTNHLCDRYYTEEDDGLIQDWDGHVFCNPPYGRTLGKWVEKAAKTKRGGGSWFFSFLHEQIHLTGATGYSLTLQIFGS